MFRSHLLLSCGLGFRPQTLAARPPRNRFVHGWPLASVTIDGLYVTRAVPALLITP